MKRKAGFTLVEIAIVLVIIGLLAGGVLKGQQMIENAKYKSLLKDIDAFRAVVYTFQDRYKYFPGDFNRASSVFSSLGVTIYNGNGDGVVYGGGCYESAPLMEPCLAWQHLVAAGLISGDPALTFGNAMRSTPVGGAYQSVSTGAWASDKIGTWLLLWQFPGEIAQRLDDEFDDGKASSGSVICYVAENVPCTTADASDNYQENQSYRVFVRL